MHSLVRRAALALAVAGCTPRESDAVDAPPPVRTPQDLGIEVPPWTGADVDSHGAEVWLGVDSLVVVDRSRGLRQLGAPTIDANGLVVGLYEALDPLPRGGALRLSVDRRVSARLLGHVLHTATRCRWPVSLRGDGDGGVLNIEPAPFTSSHPPAHPPFARLAADLLLEWDEHGVRAVAQLRPAERAPFAIDWYEDEAPQLSQRVPLRLAEGPGPPEPLDRDAVLRLASALCAINEGPTGVSVRPLPTTPYAELLAIATAAQPEGECRGTVRLELREPIPAPTGAVTIPGLIAHMRAQLQR